MIDLKQMYRTPVPEAHPAQITVTLGDRQIVYRKVTWPAESGAVGLRYGENPHQPAAFYAPEGMPSVLGSLSWVKLGKGGPSWINLADMDHALRILRYFPRPAAAVMKHLNPAGVAVQVGDEPLAEVYKAARECDSRASFGAVAAFNRVVDADTAREVLTTYVEAVVAPGYSDEAATLLATKKDLRVAAVAGLEQLPRFVGDPAGYDLKVLADGSLLLQQPFLTAVRAAEDLVAPGGRQPARTRSAASRGRRTPSWPTCCLPGTSRPASAPTPSCWPAAGEPWPWAQASRSALGRWSRPSTRRGTRATTCRARWSARMPFSLPGRHRRTG